MKYILAIICVAFSCSALQASHTKSQSVRSKCVSQKAYLTQSKIKYLSKGFLVFTKQGSYLTKAIRCDKKGMYILSRDITVAPKGHHHSHNWYDAYCGRSGNTRDVVWAYGSQREGRQCSAGYAFDRPYHNPVEDRYNGAMIGP